MRAASVAALIAVVIAAAAPAGAAGLSGAPAYAGDFPDPFVVAVPGGYAAYGTGTAGTNLQVMLSTDLRHWTPPADPLPHLPPWAAPGTTWAPGVAPISGRWVMYYTAHRSSTGTQCIGVATATTPAGPFVGGSAQPLICQPPGSIDPSPFLAADGARYLVWKSDDNRIPGVATRLWSVRLSPDGRATVGPPALLLTATSGWQGNLIEGPAMVRDGPVELLFYSANRWDTASSGIGYAVCLSPAGPCVNMSLLRPWLGTSARVTGPQGPAVFAGPGGQQELAYAAWTGGVGYANGGRRSLWIDPLRLVVGLPALGGAVSGP